MPHLRIAALEAQLAERNAQPAGRLSRLFRRARKSVAHCARCLHHDEAHAALAAVRQLRYHEAAATDARRRLSAIIGTTPTGLRAYS